MYVSTLHCHLSLVRGCILYRIFCSDFLCGLIWTEAEKNKTQNETQFFWKPVFHKSTNKTAYVGSLRVNHSDMASRFIVGRIDLPLTDRCSVDNANRTVLNYNTTITNTSKFSEDGVIMSINADALPTDVSIKCGRKIIMHGA